MSVGSLCNREVVVAEKETSAAEAAKLMRSFHVGDLVVLDAGDDRKPIGLITDRDVVLAVVAAGLDPESVTVMDIMTETLEVAGEDADFWDALGVMRRRGIRRLPIVNDRGGLEGILTLDDALELVSEALSDLVGLVAREVEHEETVRPAAAPD